ncbi:hypothetical protein VTK26DRAFT_5789 [Humicola hyalothermophila]
MCYYGHINHGCGCPVVHRRWCSDMSGRNPKPEHHQRPIYECIKVAWDPPGQWIIWCDRCHDRWLNAVTAAWERKWEALIHDPGNDEARRTYLEQERASRQFSFKRVLDSLTKVSHSVQHGECLCSVPSVDESMYSCRHSGGVWAALGLGT